MPARAFAAPQAPIAAQGTAETPNGSNRTCRPPEEDFAADALSGREAPLDKLIPVSKRIVNALAAHGMNGARAA